MAYSDYGGYAYRNGKRVEERSDFTIRPDGSGFGTPGCYPGFALLASGASESTVRVAMGWPHHHVVIGDGPLYVALHKQDGLIVYRGAKAVNLIPLVPNECIAEGEGERYFALPDPDEYRGWPIKFEIDAHKIEVTRTRSDNYYLFSRLTQPDGTIWTAFSGYGVGAGLEDCRYGYDTNDCVIELEILFPTNQTT